jgi:hypothetical protein
MVMTIKVTFSSIKVTLSSVYLSSIALFEPFARAQIQNRAGEKHNRCDSKNGVVHEKEDRVCVLRKWSAVDKEVVRALGRRRKQTMT